METAEEEQTSRLSCSLLSASRGNAEAFLNNEQDSEHFTWTNRFNSQLPSVEGTTSVLVDDDKVGPEVTHPGNCWRSVDRNPNGYTSQLLHLGPGILMWSHLCLDLFDTLPLSLG